MMRIFHLIAISLIGCSQTAFSQDLIAKLNPLYKDAVSSEIVKNAKLKSLFSHLEVVKVKEAFPKKIKKSVLDGVIGLTLKDKMYVDKVKEILIHSGYFQYVETNKKSENQALHIPSDPFAEPLNGSQYYLQTVNAYKAWDISKGDTNMTICIVDNGLDFSHPEFQGKIQYNKKDPIDGLDNDNDGFTDNYAGWDFANDDNFAEDTTGSTGHGTEVSGIAAGLTNNNFGIASMGYNCRFLPYKIFGNNAVSSSTQYQAVAYAALQGCKVINMSWGIYGTGANFNQYEQDLINFASVEQDAVLVGATFPKEGNYFTFPGDYENVLSVLSLFSDDTKSIPQATHYWIDMSVPGLDMITTGLNGSFTTQTGISVGLPLVTGAAALARTKYPKMNSTQIQELLRVTSRNIDTVKTNKNYKEKLGHGCLDAYKLLTDTITPAIRIQAYELTNLSNDTLSLQLGFKNYLWPSKTLKFSFRMISGGFTVYDSIANMGTVKTLDSTNTLKGDFKLKILPYDKSRNVELVRIGIEDTANKYTDYQYIYINKNNVPVITLLDNKENVDPEMKAYPNPCVETLIVENYKGEEVLLCDLTGKVLAKNSDKSGIANFDMSGFPQGIYFVQTKSGESTSHIKIIKK
ncbi:MAG: S8 family peptidase [Opitutaceae bacterium]|nr:S8 family peptidase [Cytophagales bacterium]